MESNYQKITRSALKSSLNKFRKEAVNNTYKLYFAGPWFTEKSCMMYDYCKDVYEAVKERSCYEVYFPRDYQYATPKETFDANVKQIQECDFLVAMISEKDVGTAWEIGLAQGLKKPIVYIVYDETCLDIKTNIMLSNASNFAFGISDWHKFLKEGVIKAFKYNNETWEGKE